MPEITQCPECGRKLKVPESLQGKSVKCPGCQKIFTATFGDEAAEEHEEEIPQARRREAEPEAAEEDEARPRKRRPVPDDEDEDEDDGGDDYEERPRRKKRRRMRRDFEPHRGGTILTIAIVGFFCFGIILGPIAWVMGSNDMRAIREGRMDPDGEGMTRAGQVIGIIVTILAFGGCILWGVIMMSGMAGGRGRF